MDGFKLGDKADVKVIREGEEVDASYAKQRWLKKQDRLKQLGISIGRNERCPCRSGYKNKHCHNVKRWSRNPDGTIQGWK